MSIQNVRDRSVLKVIVRSTDSALDDVVLECPDLTWNQIFITIDRLSREGVLKFVSDGRGRYTIHVANHAVQEVCHGAPV